MKLADDITSALRDRDLNPGGELRVVDIVYPLVGYVLLYAAVNYLANTYVLNDAFLSREWAEMVGEEQIESFSSRRARWMRLGYVLIPVGVILKTLLPALCIATGCAVVGWDIRFRDLYHATVRAEVVFAFAAVVNLVWSMTFMDFESLFDYTSFYSLSMLNLASIEVDEAWMIYPLKTMNAYEVSYVGVLAILLGKCSRRRFSQRLFLVGATYGLGLVLLVCVITFATLYIT